MAAVKSEHAQAYGFQATGILLIAIGTGAILGWGWALLSLGVLLVALGVAQELR